MEHDLVHDCVWWCRVCFDIHPDKHAREHRRGERGFVWYAHSFLRVGVSSPDKSHLSDSFCSAATPASNAATLSPGAIVGIVALGMAVLALPLIVVLIRRYRRAYPDDSEDAIKVRRHHSGRRSVFEPPTPVPFRAWYSTPTPEESFPLKATNHSSQGASRSTIPADRESDIIFPASASSAAPPLARGSRDKASDQFVLRVSNDPGERLTLSLGARALCLRWRPAGDAPDPMPMLAPEVVDHIVHQVSQRIDPADGLRALPPSAYPPSYRSRSSMPARVRARRTMG